MIHRVASFLRRNAATIPLVITAISLLGTFTILSISNARQSEQIRQQNRVIQQQGRILEETKSIAKQIRDSSDDNKKYLLCILALVRHKNFETYYISDFATCTITNQSNGSTEVLTLPQSSPQPQPKAQKPAKPSGTTQQPATPPKHPSQGGTSGGGTSNPPSQPAQQPVRQLVQDIVSLPLALIRQIPIVGGKP